MLADSRIATFVLGPTFRLATADGSDEAGDRLEHALGGLDRFELTRVGEHFQVAVSRAHRHRWSPWLTLELRDADGGCDAFGRFNPSPGIWTGYMLASLSLLTIASGGVLWGLAELMMDRPPLAFWAVPISLAALVLMWLISAAGQRLARDEMADIRSAVEAALVGGAGA